MIDLVDLVFDSQTPLWIVAGFALSGFLVMTGLYQLLSRRENRAEARSRRLRMVERGASAEEVLAILKPKAEQGLLDRMPVIGSVPGMLRQSGLALTPGRFFLISAALGVVLATALSSTIPAGPAILGGLAAGLILPMMILNAIRTRRMDRMTMLLPDALDLMARGLRVGHPLNTSIAAVAAELPDPIGTEFGLIADQIAFGDDLVDAVQEFAARVDLEDVHYFAASVAIQHGTGGDLASIIDTLAKVVRDRITLRRKVKAISAEGRLTAYFLTALPFLIFGMNMIMNPDYYMGVSTDPLFLPMAIAIVTLVALNGVVLRHLANIRY